MVPPLKAIFPESETTPGDDNTSDLPGSEEEEKGELLASAHLEFKDDSQPKKEEEKDDQDDSNEDNAEKLFN